MEPMRRKRNFFLSVENWQKSTKFADTSDRFSKVFPTRIEKLAEFHPIHVGWKVKFHPIDVKLKVKFHLIDIGWKVDFSPMKGRGRRKIFRNFSECQKFYVRRNFGIFSTCR